MLLCGIIFLTDNLCYLTGDFTKGDGTGGKSSEYFCPENLLVSFPCQLSGFVLVDGTLALGILADISGFSVPK